MAVTRLRSGYLLYLCWTIKIYLYQHRNLKILTISQSMSILIITHLNLTFSVLLNVCVFKFTRKFPQCLSISYTHCLASRLLLRLIATFRPHSCKTFSELLLLLNCLILARSSFNQLKSLTFSSVICMFINVVSYCGEYC